MALSKNIRHCRYCAVLPINQPISSCSRYHSGSSQAEDVPKMSVRNLNNTNWKLLTTVRDYITKVKADNITVEINKELAIFLQKIKPNIYGSKIIRDLGFQSRLSSTETSSTTAPTKETTTEPTPKEGYKLPKVLTGLGFGNQKLETTPQAKKPQVLPKWKRKQQNVLISASSISSRTSHVIAMIASAESEESQLKRIEALSTHLEDFPDAKNQAVKSGAIRLLLRIREQSKNVQIQRTIAEAFARLGYVDPPPGRGIRILSIDGGGIRGLVVLEMLKKIELLTGRKVHELFDYVCGVSTGAILIGAVIVSRRSLDEASKYYKELSTKIFTQNALLGTSNLVLKQSYYDTNMWESLLKEYLGEIPLIKTSQDPLCPKISSVSAVVNQSQLSAFLFRNYALPYRVCSQYPGSSDCAVWQAARASAAAPTYFEEFMLDGLLHQDGGIMVNNPTAIAIHEAKQLWPKQPIQCVLSFGTGRAHPTPCSAEDVASPALSSSWKNKFLKILDSATDTEGVHTVLSDLLPPYTYYRFNPYLTEYLSMVEIRPEKLKQMEQDVAMYLRRNEDKFEQAAKQLTQNRLPNQKIHDWMERQQIILGLQSTVS